MFISGLQLVNAIMGSTTPKMDVNRGGGKQRCLGLQRCLLVSFVMAVITAIANLIVMPPVFQYFLKKELVINEGSTAFSEWKDPSVPVTTKMYLFSIQNPDDFLIKGAKPSLRQMGPYTFREESEIVNIRWSKDSGNVTYNVRKYWYFDPSLSSGNLSDMVTTINVPVLASASATKNNFFLQWGLSSTLDSIGSTIFIEKSVGELLFHGYEDPLLSIAEWFGKDSIGVPTDKFGWFYKRNGTSWADGEFNMHTGSSDIHNLGKIISWNGQTRTHYPGECGEIHGSAGGFFPPKTAGNKVLLFAHEACRTLAFNFKHWGEINGIPTRIYKLDETTFANASVYSGNACFNNNLPSGLQNATRCKRNSPAFLSFPHFYHADPFYLDQFESGLLNPMSNHHESRIAIEPTTGLPLEVVMRLQINVRLEPFQDITLLQSVPKGLYFPALWFEASAKVPMDMSQSLKLVLAMPDILFYVGAFSVGMALIQCVVIVTMRIFMKQPDKEDELDSRSFSCEKLLKTQR